MAGLLADPELLRRSVQPVQCRIDLRQLSRDPGGKRGFELGLHGVGAPIGRVEGKRSQVSRAILVGLVGMLGDRSVERSERPRALLLKPMLYMGSLFGGK